MTKLRELLMKEHPVVSPVKLRGVAVVSEDECPSVKPHKPVTMKGCKPDSHFHVTNQAEARAKAMMLKTGMGRLRRNSND